MLLLAALLAAQAADPAPRVKVQAAAFVVERAGTVRPEVTTVVPNEPGVCYRWLLRVKPEPRVAEIEERFTLPATAERWNTAPGDDVTVSADGRTATKRMQLSLAGGIVTNGWCVAEGDPSGPHVIEVSSGGRLLRRFEFTVGVSPSI